MLVAASWFLPDHRVGCSKQGWRPDPMLPPADQPADTPPCPAGRPLLPAVLRVQGPRRTHRPGGLFLSASGACFPAAQHCLTALCRCAPPSVAWCQFPVLTRAISGLGFQNKIPCLRLNKIKIQKHFVNPKGKLNKVGNNKSWNFM